MYRLSLSNLVLILPLNRTILKKNEVLRMRSPRGADIMVFIILSKICKGQDSASGREGYLSSVYPLCDSLGSREKGIYHVFTYTKNKKVTMTLIANTVDFQSVCAVSTHTNFGLQKSDFASHTNSRFEFQMN